MRFNILILWFFIVTLVCMGVMAGCQTIGHASGSQKILTKHLLLIPGQGPLHITWESRHITIAFKGKVDQGLLTMNGDIGITGGGIQHFSMLDRLVVDIYLADAAGNVLEKHKFYSTDKAPVDYGVPRRFERSYPLPKGATRIAFGYDGEAREGGSKVFPRQGDAIEHGFQHSPFR